MLTDPETTWGGAGMVFEKMRVHMHQMLANPQLKKCLRVGFLMLCEGEPGRSVEKAFWSWGGTQELMQAGA